MPSENPVAELLGAEIRRSGPISFHRFMEQALYHPAHGYYTRAHDPFGRHGDYYTAEQLQPVFGILIARRIRELIAELGREEDVVVVELGAGRGEMMEAFGEFRYLPVDVGRNSLPERMCGVVFSNEFFDALPVECGVWRAGELRELRVGRNNDRFVWVEGGRARDEVADYVRRYFPPLEEGAAVEMNLEALDWIRRIANSLEAGFHLAIDYGYTRREFARFPAGTLMSYRSHTALEDVLAAPGEQDITAHVNFTALSEWGADNGLRTASLEPLAQTLLAAGKHDEFAELLAAADPKEEARRRQQLKSLLFGMGETFRTLVQRKAEDWGARSEK